MTPEITLHGWVHVHSYTESHGEYHDMVYQEELKQFQPVKLLTVRIYCNNPNTGVFFDSDKHTPNYLLAKEILANPQKYQPRVKENISPCFTSSWKDFYNLSSDTYYRVMSVAGHGSWAFPIIEN